MVRCGRKHPTPLATIADGETGHDAGAGPAVSPQSIDIVDGSLVLTANDGVHRLPGALPTAPDTTTPLQQFLPVTGAVDSVFVDTDGVARRRHGVRHARHARRVEVRARRRHLAAARQRDRQLQLRRGARRRGRGRGLPHAARQRQGAQARRHRRDRWRARRRRAPRRWPTRRRALASPASRSRRAPASRPTARRTRRRRRRCTASATTVDTHLGATPKATLALEVFDPNSAGRDGDRRLGEPRRSCPNDKITITGSGPDAHGHVRPDRDRHDHRRRSRRAPVSRRPRSTVSLRTSGGDGRPGGHYYSGLVDLSAAIDVGGDYFLGVSDEVNTIRLFKKGVERRLDRVLERRASRRRDRLRGRDALRRHARVVGLARQQPLGQRASGASLPRVPEDHGQRRQGRPHVVALVHAPVGSVEGVGRGQRSRAGREQAQVQHRARSRACSRTRRTASTSRA